MIYFLGLPLVFVLRPLEPNVYLPEAPHEELVLRDTTVSHTLLIQLHNLNLKVYQ